MYKRQVFEFSDIVSAENVRVMSGGEKLDCSVTDAGGRVTVSLPPIEISADLMKIRLSLYFQQDH